MTVLLDTSVLMAANNRRDEHHERSLTLIEEARRGVHGEPMTTDFVLDELVTVALARTGSHEVALTAERFVLPLDASAQWVRLEPVGREEFLRALDLFAESRRRDLSFTDWTIVAAIQCGKSDAVMSFDEDFDGLVPRIS